MVHVADRFYIAPYWVLQFTYKEQNANTPDLPDTISHTFYNCRHSNKLWMDLKKILGHTNPDIDFSKTNVLFGIKNEKSNTHYNSIILTTKNIYGTAGSLQTPDLIWMY